MAKSTEVKPPKSDKKESKEKVLKITAGRFKGESFEEKLKEVAIYDDSGNKITESKDKDFQTALQNCHAIEKYAPHEGPFSYGFTKGLPYIVRKDDLV